MAGSNCKDLQRRFGTFVTVDTARREMICVGGRTNEAVAAVRRQITGLQAPGGVVAAYAHPKRVLYVLPETESGRWSFGPYAGPHVALPNGPNK
ncbi:hypothetical protein FOA52_007919 [Chlamydomonas sp. UWO 241]|nr:hypothetical protein FOA52_007919 [Chlamydomonas sp. UWO 241]